jgi:serine/threonine protein kinase/WD40 repeat protein
MTEEELFHAALAKPKENRKAFLDQACSGNDSLRASVEALLAAHESAGSFLNTAALDANPNQADLAATVDSHIGADANPSGNARHRPSTRLDSESNDPLSPSTTTILPGSTGATLDGRYTLLEKIGEGGMGEVWVAKQTEPVKRKVALKLIKRGMDSRAVLQRFEQERQALAMMDHPNIARVLDGGMTPTGQPYFAMELVNGLPLTKFCDEMKLTLNQRLELFVPICQAVQHAHQKGIVHRDLKPANILVTMIDGRPVPKVIDFGVAKATAGKLTEETMSTGFGSVVGTLEYMSPEQAAFSGEDIDTRADIYSLGVILYELLTGLRPIDANRLRKAALTEMMRIIREEEPSKPSTRLSTNESLPSLAAIRQIEPHKLTALLRGELDWVVMKCLEKQRDRRYETANALARDVQRYLADEAVEARPPSAAYRLRKFVTRNKASVVAVSSVAASLLVGLVGFAWQAHVASEQRDLAIEAKKSESTQRVLAEKARDAEAEALKVSERSLFESRHNAARLAYERAQILCEEGEADVGLLEMARCLEMTPAGDSALDRAIRTSMNLWAGQTNLVQRRWEPRENKMQNVRSIAFSPDGSNVLLVDMVLGAEIVESQTGKLKCALPFGAPEPADESYYNQGIYSPNGQYVSVLCRDHSFARIWDAATGVLVGKPIEHEAPITGICFDPSSKILVTCEGTTIHFWNISDGTRVWDPIVLEDNLYGVDISSDGKWLLAWPYGPPKVYVLNYPTREFAYTLEGIDFNVSHASFSPDNRWIFTSGFQESDGSVPPFAAQFWNVETGEPVGRRIRSDSEPASGDAFSHRASFRSDSQVVVTGGEPIRMWHVPSGSPLGAAASSQLGRRPVFLPNSQQLATAEYIDFRTMGVAPFLTPYCTAHLLEENDQQLRIFRRDALNIAPDGKTAVVKMVDQKQVFFHLFDLQSGASIGDQDAEQGYVPNAGWEPPPLL